ncbi:MAG: cytochrome c3 family protein [Sandaracinus sp.]|nr:cytochrome c3 family protein [Sandaracinus sp.]
MRFSHATHAREGVRCLDCHEGVTRSALATTSHLPTMESCFRCHGGDGLASSRAGCTDDVRHVPPHALGRAASNELPEGELVPPAWLHGMLHDRDFLVRHRWVAADASEACASCHAERECADCHDGRTRPQSVHPNDYLTTHPTEALRGTPRCESCHTTQRFCTECHARLGLSTMSSPGAVSARLSSARLRAGARRRRATLADHVRELPLRARLRHLPRSDRRWCHLAASALVRDALPRGLRSEPARVRDLPRSGRVGGGLTLPLIARVAATKR